VPDRKIDPAAVNFSVGVLFGAVGVHFLVGPAWALIAVGGGLVVHAVVMRLRR
jgi:hypothetical protein